MAETLPAQMPPDPMSQAKDRMVELAGETAKDMAWRATVRQIKGYVPRMFWPLIPGEGGSVQENMKGAASKWFWGLVSSVIISGLFFAVFAVAISSFLVFLAYAVISSM
jgi:hypothetical protein